MNKKSLVLIALVIFFMVVLYWNDHNSEVENIEKTIKLDSAEQNQQNYVAPQEQLTKDETQINSSDQSQIQSMDNTTISTEEIEIQKKFSQNLKTISECLEIPNAQIKSAAEPNLTELNDVLKQGLGEMVVYMDDWSESQVQFPDGTKKNFREEMSYEDPKNPTKYLMVYKIHDQGPMEMETLDPNKSQNPTPEYIDSLKIGSTLNSEEKGGRVYYPNNEELVVVEKNGRLESLSMSRKNKFISCNDLNTLKGECLCQ